MSFSALNLDELTAQRDRALRDYEALVQRGLSLDLTRGKPSGRQLDLASALLALPGGHTAADGTDCRNYGGLQGLPEIREMFGGLLQVPAGQLIAAGNSSLSLMHDSIVHALLGRVPGAERRWVEEPRIAFLCPVPGYDRHFALCERFGIELIAVPMTAEGPDMDVVERLVLEDPQVKGIWCVPKYSNPSGVSYSDETVRRLAAMPAAAPDFRIFWDNAYAVHHLTDTPVEIADLLALCAESGNPDRAFVFGSTSKITFSGGGVAFFGSSPANVAWLLGHMAKGTIGPDKINQLRHVEFLRDEDGVLEHMRRHRELIRPKFDAVDLILTKELGGTGLASWSNPAGGYFIGLDVLEGCARQVVSRAAEAGIALTPAGATHPYGDDPRDSTIRIAPTYPELDEVELAIAGLAVCVRLVGTEKLLEQAR
ncbi:aminotransferase class I/II-fold pyridoxal phosphate-dependent enzyme [Streptosporangium roseum]|uniref:Transcriptional regulator, GntR family n=1 Tax=Streptosporangium roseum (strain ATCC 12428 / DSM 43021 / JCM 3005 / KCTC 9067 / NCIMB 10171 / NRRL 2505 / NI 9100) TaxID=479432 RepID=D2B139_STRRD|nr:aminotransferase class I/II-fold pyridoxal phosphate-dependent enzyme [Streptosporangium roseum]ACZ83446.1 putative transcriptional regulator, GntR family [Streptosporangium roseum DSM 43021]